MITISTFKIHTVYNQILTATIIIFLAFIPTKFITAQCTSTIVSFPYREDFETTGGNWFAGGVLTDWTWGAPSKAIISKAGSGQKCWITGGLTGNMYNLGEQSWLQSPCFDFSLLQYPYISFKVFWETESRYDGTTMEYSTDNGNTWQILGGFNDAKNCLNTNWFNNPSIIKLPASQGWCGNIQSGDGSGTWVSAQHTLPFLAGFSKVIFRFFFGVGTVQNDYNGFAVDDITIGEAPANNAAFTFNCTSANTVSFTDASANCPTSFSWNFDDPSSGISNTSSSINPVHTFSAAGTYNVSLTVSGPGNAPSTITKKVSVLSLYAGAYTTMLNCNGGNDGTATVLVSGGTGAYTYNWNTIPLQTKATATSLSAGTYTVSVSSPNSCTATKDFIIAEPPKLNLSLTSQSALCSSNNGSITAMVSGGTIPYKYTWTPGNANTPFITDLAAGKYYLTVTDINGCMLNDSTVVKDTSTLQVFLVSQPAQCSSSTGSVTATVSGGTIPYDYAWRPSNANGPVITDLSAGKYYLTVTDKNGCMANDSAVVKDTSTLQLFIIAQSSFCGNSNGSLTATVTGGMVPYNYMWQPANINAATISVAAGKYYLTVTDMNGCMINDSATVKDTDTLKISLGKDTTICPGDMFKLNPGAFSSYAWQDNSMLPTFTVTQEGTYWVHVTDAQNCIATDTIAIISDCGEIYFPTAFTPDGDGKNEYFGPLGNLSAVKHYQLSIYNRWGQLIFQSTDPFKKWDGKLKSNNREVNTFTWFASFTYRNQTNILRKGTVTTIQ